MTRRELLSSKVLSRLGESGFAARFVSPEHLHELKDEIERTHSQGLFDDGVYSEYLSGFDFAVPNVISEARSVIVVAAPQPALQATFMWDGRPHEAVVPPTYRHDTDQQVCGCIMEVLGPEGYQLVAGALPKKLLAVRSGLAKYGKNNITYVEGMGSYHRLTAFYTDALLSGDSWQEPQMLDRCQTCTACVKKCPTGAISSDRFLLHAEKCLTYHNESDKRFPEWIDPSWHNCLIGCLICQNVCPANPPSLRRTLHVATFSDEETELIVKNVPRDNLSQETLEKLKRISLLDGYQVVSRNLSALLKARS
jgi:epoxyqueuosine reductase